MSDKLRIEGVNCQGFGIIPKLVMRDRMLSCGAKALYAYVCSYAGNGDTAWPGRELIIRDLNISKNTYNSYLNELKESDYIRTKQERSKTGIFMHNIFILVSSPVIPGTKIWATDEPYTKKREPEKREPKNRDNNKNNVLIKTGIIKKQQENHQKDDVVAFSDLKTNLKSIGFSDKNIDQIIKIYDASVIANYTNFVKRSDNIDNKPGWVVSALKESWALHDGAKESVDHLKEKTKLLQQDIKKAQDQAASPDIMEKYLNEIKNFFRFPGNGNLSAIDV